MNNQAAQTMPTRPEFTVDEALRIADQNAEAYDKVASVSRTLATEVRRLAALSQTAGVPSWIVNDLGELGVMVNGVAYFLYKGDNIVYEDAKHDDGSPMLYRIVGKREFGETCWPRKWIEAGRREDRYTDKLHYAPGLSDGKPEDGDWLPLPTQVAAPAASGGEDECGANFTGHKFGPHGPKGATQCEWCGEEPQPPAGASVSEDAAFEAWFSGEQGKAYDGMWSFARAAWMKRAALEQALTQQRGTGVGVDVTGDGTHVVVREGSTIVYSEFHPLITTPKPGAEALREAVSWSVLQIGNRGAAYDPPRSRRAYTYQHQPGNLEAHRLGVALSVAADATYGDNIDRGLSLLKALEYVGFGVFQIGVPTHQPCADAVRELAQRWRQEAEDNKHLGGSWHKTELCNMHADELESLLGRGAE